MKLKKMILSLLLLLPICVLADVTLTDETFTQVVNRLKKDKAIIETEQIRWDKLSTTVPVINYKIEDKKVIIQTVELPIYNTKPLIYQVSFEVDTAVPQDKLFPFQLFLAGAYEPKGVNAKVGMQFINLQRFAAHPIGINAMIDVRSVDVSLSYTIPKPFENAMLHVYVGKTYTLGTTFGVGVSLNL